MDSLSIFSFLFHDAFRSQPSSLEVKGVIFLNKMGSSFFFFFFLELGSVLPGPPQMVQRLKNPSVMQEMQVQSLDWEAPLE